jgi:tetratricopeptide (TPR) repeat protein
MAAEFRVFLSAVTNEFGSARDTLAASLRSRDLLLRVQSDFRQQADADTTLRKLHDYIRDCTAVVCVIGRRSGAMPPAASAAPFAAMLPPGVSEASYTQWEFFFARHYKRRLSIYIATDAWKPEKDAPPADRPDLQRGLIRYIVEEQGLDRDYFGDVHHLCHLVLKEHWPQELPPKPVVLPYPSLGSLFKGRETFLDRLHVSLHKGVTAAIAGKAVHGMGGVGKTRAAVEYAWQYRNDYTALFLLSADTPDKLQTAVGALAAPLRLPAAALPDEREWFEAVLAWLNANPGWLLILDNIDDAPALTAAHELLGRLRGGGHVLMTSRLTQFPRDIERLDLDVLAFDDAAAFLLEATETGRRRAPDDGDRARALAEALGGLALALEMAAATIEARRLSFAAYQEMWQGNRARVIGWASQEITGYHHAVAETWQTSVDQLTSAGRELLQRLAFLAPEPVPESLLDVPVPDVAAAGDPHAALDDLAKYSLARRDPEAGTFLLHRLIQDVTRRGLAQAGTERQRLTEALGWMNAAFVGHPQDVRTWPILTPLAPHAEAVAGYADAAGIAEAALDVVSRLGVLFMAKALPMQAEAFSRRALASAESKFRPNDARIAIRLNNLAQVLQTTNRPGEAELLMRRALDIDEASYGPDHPEVATDLINIAGLLGATNRTDEAEPMMRRALGIDEASYGPDHPSVACDLNNLAQLLQATNRLSEAEPLMRRALGIHEVNYGPDHPMVAIGLNNLAGLLQATNRLGEAEPLMRRALGIDEACYGPDHPDVAIRLNNLATLQHDTNRLSEAEPLMRRALGIDEASYGPDHPNVAIDLNNLALLLKATNRLGEAEPLMRRQLAIFLGFERDTGHAHPHRGAAINNYAALLSEIGKSEAEIVATLMALKRESGLDPG